MRVRIPPGVQIGLIVQWIERDPAKVEIPVRVWVRSLNCPMVELATQPTLTRQISGSNPDRTTMIHTIYKTTNLITSMHYIGYHSTENINDNYLGSGKYLKRAIKKYGKTNFVKEILFVFDNREDALLKEAEIVNREFVLSTDNYNFKEGGIGGINHIRRLLIEDSGFRKKYCETQSKNFYKGKSGLSKWINKNGSGFKDKKHDVETKKLIRKKLDDHFKLKNEDRIELIKKSKIDFNKYGWIQELSTLIEIEPQKVSIWMKKHMNDFYLKCYRRRPNTI